MRENSVLRVWFAGGWQTALGAGALATDAAMRFAAERRETIAFAAFTFGGTLALYGGRYALSALRGGDGERETALLTSPAPIFVSLSVGLLLSGYGAWMLPWTFAAWSAAWGLTGVAYCFPILGKPWREYGALKPALLALSWTAITCGPPVHEHWVKLAAVRLVWLFGLCVAFDYKDVEADRALGVRTPAATWSERTLWGVVTGCLVAGLIGKLLIVPPPMRAPVLLAWIVSLLMLAQIRRSRSTRDWVMWGDGMMIAYALIPVLVMLFA
jgi:4-hydroxybenzoate polyprenyltransferase